MTYLLNIYPSYNNGSWSNIADVLVDPRQLIYSKQSINQLVTGQLYQDPSGGFAKRHSSSGTHVISTSIQLLLLYYLLYYCIANRLLH